MHPSVEVGIDRRTLDPYRGFSSPVSFLEAIRAAAITPDRVDERLRPLAAAGSDEQGTYSDPHGGFFIPSAMAPNVLNAQEGGEEDPSLGRMLDVPMLAAEVFVNARYDRAHSTTTQGSLIVYRNPETVEIPASRMVFEQVRLEAHTLIGLTFATSKLVTDSFPSFAAIVNAGYRGEMAAQLLEERIQGTGVGEYGVLRSPALIVVPKENGQAAQTIVGDNMRRGFDGTTGQRLAASTTSNLPAIRVMSNAIGRARAAAQALKLQTVPDVAAAIEQLRQSIPTIDQAEEQADLEAAS